MPSFRRRWWKDFDRRLTIMVVPHGTARPRQISFSVPFVLFLFTCWTGLTGWASYLASQRFDYWRVKANSHLLRIKLDYFAGQLKSSREMMDEVKEMDRQLRTLLSLGSRDAIIQAAEAPAGGPSLMDEAQLAQALESRVGEASFQDISLHIAALRQEAEARLQSFREVQAKIEEERRVFRCTPNVWPASGYLTSHFGIRLSPFSGVEESHKGMDIAAPAGTPIRATADGIVQLAGWAGGYGKVVVLDHGYGYSTRYGHNRQVMVKRGDRVKRGQIIALMGQTGSATGPHCHYEVWHRGRAVNPKRFMGEPDA